MSWLDAVKGVAILWIVLDHIAERTWGVPFAGNRFTVPLSERIAEWAPLQNGFATVIRDIGWTGDQGVAVFLILSGLGLAYGLARRDAPAHLALAAFYRARAVRIYPPWWTAHLVLAAAIIGALAFGVPMHLNLYRFVPSFALSLTGVRPTPLVTSWWFIGLLLQCYLAFPLLWWCARRWEAWKMALVCVIFGLAGRLSGEVLLHTMGGTTVLGRLPELGLGIALGIWFAEHPERIDRVLRAPWAIALALVSLAVGFALTFTPEGMAVAPFLMGTAVCVLGYAAFVNLRAPGVIGWFGANSYVIYLAHDPILAALSSRHVLAWWAK